MSQVLHIALNKLTPEQLEQVHTLELSMPQVRLLPVDASQAIYIIEAKLGPNQWEPVSQVYTEIEDLRSYYLDERDALSAKASLKALLRSNRKMQAMKLPIRVRKV
jgi:hypothetical protein